MKNNKFIKAGFTLMEMMIVLLIVATIAAAAAPLIMKDKMSRNEGEVSSSAGVTADTGRQTEVAELRDKLTAYEERLQEFERRLSRLERAGSMDLESESDYDR